MNTITAYDIARMIDHSLLNPAFTSDEIRKGCEIAKQCHAATVCVRPSDVPLARTLLLNTDVQVTTVVGFPHGSNATATKLFEAQLAIDQGATELDMVLNIGLLKSGMYEDVERDIRAVVMLAHAANVAVKVILENAYLNDELIETASKIAEKAGADFVKTSTGYAPSGATIHDLKIMRAAVSERVQVKAAGGVRTLDDALLVRAVGGTRFGSTRTREILDEAKKREAEGTLLLPDITDDSEFAAVRAAR